MKHSIKMVPFSKNHPPSRIKNVTKMEHTDFFCRFHYYQKWNTMEDILLIYRYFLRF